MIKKNLKVLIITSIVILLPILAGLLLWNKLPQQLPFHWNAQGQVDGWASKYMAVFGMPGILLALQWLCALATGADPKKQSHSDKILHLVLWIIPVLNLFLSVLTYTAALGTNVRMELVMPIFMGLLFTVIGNYLSKCKQNYTIGIKIVWTLHSEENWNRTHRFAGKLWVICGIAMMLTGFLGSFWVFFGILLVMIISTFLYSFILYKKGI